MLLGGTPMKKDPMDRAFDPLARCLIEPGRVCRPLRAMDVPWDRDEAKSKHRGCYVVLKGPFHS